MPDVGDEIMLVAKKVGQEARRGTVTKVSGGTMLTVRWLSGEESVFVPGPGALTVVGHASKKASGKKQQG